MNGLEEFQLARAIQVFPDVFEFLFVGSYELKSTDVLDILHPKVSASQNEVKVYGYLKQFIMECNREGNC